MVVVVDTERSDCERAPTGGLAGLEAVVLGVCRREDVVGPFGGGTYVLFGSTLLAVDTEDGALGTEIACG